MYSALTPGAARARLEAARPADYANSRNHLEGAVTRLSPFITHGLLSVPEVMQTLQLPLTHKLSFQLGWRAYFHHVWQHEGDGILASLHAGPLPDADYADQAQAIPLDLREGRTGVPVIDAAVRDLYLHGQLHNHARLWLASYMVHLRKLHWRSGADWLYAHLQDGDLASNHLSWQWVAGTSSHKPYLFNADNVARFAPHALHSFGTCIDRSYEALDAAARGARPCGSEPGRHAGVAQPPLQAGVPDGLCTPPAAESVRAQNVWLIHPWSLAEPPTGYLPVVVLDSRFHDRWPWSVARWQAVADRLCALSTVRWCAEPQALLEALGAAASVSGIDNLHLDRSFAAALKLRPEPAAFPAPRKRCGSFSAYWKEVGLASAQAQEQTHWRS